MDRRVTVIPPSAPYKRTRVVIYCRVSTKSEAQLHSLSNQLEFLTADVADNPDWELVNVYIDIKSGSNAAGRYDLQRLLSDARAHKFDLVLIKSCSRFFRNVVDALTILHELDDLGIRVRFDEEGLCTEDGSFWIYVTTYATVAEHANRGKSENIKWGLRESAKNGTSGLYDRKCYGYTRDDAGRMVINTAQAEVVRLIFDLYLSGYSVLKIIRELQARGIPSPTGKETWYKRSIETMLTNVKYIGTAVALQTTTEGYEKKKRVPSQVIYQIDNDHEAIISKETFLAVQTQRAQRSNITIEPDGSRHRSTTRYSSKQICD